MACGSAGAQERRIALVIGNGQYANVPHLTNPARDAGAVAAVLQRLGFDTQQSVDVDRAAMERAIRNFGDRARNADVALFYFAGHAFQVSDKNLLVPTDASIADERDLRFETLDLDAVLGQVSGRTKINIVLVDACRDNPFARRLNSGTRGLRALSGPAPVSASTGNFIAFATAPGTVAEDGAGRNSPFTSALLEQIETPGLEVRQMMGRVRQSVREATKGRQIPWESSSLEGDFYFRPAMPDRPRVENASMSSTAAGREAELIFWESIKNSRHDAEYRAYVERFPDGVFAPLARARLQQLAMAVPPSDPAATILPADEQLVTVEATALRTDPAPEAGLVRRLEPWTRLKATGRTRDGKWLKAQVGGGEGFISASAAKPRDVVQNEEWRRAEAANTIEAFATYLERFPRDENTEEAGRRIDRRRAAQAPASSPSVEASPPFKLEKFDTARVPFVKPADRGRLKFYSSIRREKALALSSSGEFAWATQMPSLDEAERVALERCEFMAGTPCSLYARNDEAQLPANGEWKADRRLASDAEGPVSAGSIPFLTDAERRKMEDYASARAPKAIAIHVDGRHAAVTGRSSDEEAQQQALSRCQSSSKTPCILFAVNNSIVLSKKSSRPLSQALATNASARIAPPDVQSRNTAPRSDSVDGIWRLKVSCNASGTSSFDVRVQNRAVSFSQAVSFSSGGSGKAILVGTIGSNGEGELRGSRHVDRNGAVAGWTEILSLRLSFSDNSVSGSAVIGSNRSCSVAGTRK